MSLIGLSTLRNVLIFAAIAWSFLSSFTSSEEVDTDVICLKSIKESLQDPYGYLSSSWDFSNNTKGFICEFTGVDCWHADENKVLSIKLPNMGLKGEFPRGLVDCTSMTGLDLSHNQLSGTIPSNISGILPHVKDLDLSCNNFSGQIPQDIANCSFLNVLKLDHNQFVGSIPPAIGFMTHLTTFDVANNQLTGPVPTFLNPNIVNESLAHNSGLCGGPLQSCKQHKRRERDCSFKIGFVIGYVVFLVSSTVVSFSYCTNWVHVQSNRVIITILNMAMLVLNRRKDKIRAIDQEESSVHSEIHPEKRKEVSRMEKLATRLSYKELSEATNNFSAKNVIGLGKTGIVFKATLCDGSLLAVTRVNDSQFLEEQIILESKILGTLRHANLLPLLGFCITSTERLLVYKFMQNGNLYNWLHTSEEGQCRAKVLEWPVRAKIAVGLARALAWLHHGSDFCVIHLNLSSSCILLDQNFEPKLSNFREAMLVSRNDKYQGGASGIDSEFWELAFVKEDVFSFGVVLLELITGKDPRQMTTSASNSDGGVPSEWVRHLLSSSSSNHELIDKFLIQQGLNPEFFQFLDVAMDCVHPNPDHRPTMLQVYEHVKSLGPRHGLIDSPDTQNHSEITPASSSSHIPRVEIA